MELNDEPLKVVSREIETDNIRKKEIENVKEIRTEKIEALQREMVEEKTVHRIPTGSGALLPEARQEIELLRYAMKKHCFIRDTSSSNLKEDYSL